MKAFFVVWRTALLAVAVFGVAHAPSKGASLFLCTVALYLIFDTFAVLVAARHRSWF